MLRLSLAVGIAAASVLMLPGPAFGQGGSGTRGGFGSVSGGSPGIGVGATRGFAGTAGGGGTLDFGLLDQLTQVNQVQQAARDAAALAAREAQLQAGVDRFVHMALTFDVDSDQKLDKEELTEVAVAVIEEIQSTTKKNQPSRRRRRSRRARSAKPMPTNNAMRETFVRRALTFDQDDDGALSLSEARRMARALILSLS